MEYTPLHQAGFLDIPLSQLDNTFISPFVERSRREYLLMRFRSLIEKFMETGLKAEVWIDGSFATQKPDPNDIDIIFFIDGLEANKLSPDLQGILNELNNRTISQIRYNCDVFIIPNHDPNIRSYWRGWFGFSRNEEPKGIVRLYI
jgi:hypothetical protein